MISASAPISASPLTNGGTMQRTAEPEQLTRSNYRRDGRVQTAQDTSIGGLLRQLAADSSHLFQQQFELAKTELKESARQLPQAATKIGIAIAVGLSGVLALTAFLVILLGDLINNYAVAALIIGILLCATSALLVNRALAVTRRDFGLDDTAETLKEDAKWAKQEIKAFKREVTAHT